MLVVVFASPILLLVGAKGADNWCDGQALAALSVYSHKRVSPSAWPPGVRCSADLSDGSSLEAWWPVDW